MKHVTSDAFRKRTHQSYRKQTRIVCNSCMQGGGVTEPDIISNPNTGFLRIIAFHIKRLLISIYEIVHKNIKNYA